MPRRRITEEDQTFVMDLGGIELQPAQLISHTKITHVLKPHPVKKALSNNYFDLLKSAGTDLQCAICLEQIDCRCCFELWSCSHFYHASCSSQIVTTKCPQCNL